MKLKFTTIHTKNIEAVVGKEEMIIAAESANFNSEDFVLISFQDPDDEVDLTTVHSKWKDFIHLQFFDVVEPTVDRGKLLLPIQKNQVIELLNFIIKNKNEKFFIHCEAGVSRSAGCALALDCILEHDGNINNFNHTPHPIISHFRYTPNYFVMEELINLYNANKSTFNELVCPHCNCSIEKTIKGLKNGIEVDNCPYCFEIIS